MRTSLTTAAILGLLAAPGSASGQSGTPSEDPQSQHRADARTTGTTGTDTSTVVRAAFEDGSGAPAGEATLRETPHGVLLKVTLRGIMPGIHALHIHQTGRCEAPAFKSAGGHFAPQGRQHGFLERAGHHAGDLPNVHVPGGGDISFEYLVPDVTLSSGGSSLLDEDGSALVVHRRQDDYRTDPAGDAGDRIACAAIVP